MRGSRKTASPNSKSKNDVGVGLSNRQFSGAPSLLNKEQASIGHSDTSLKNFAVVLIGSGTFNRPPLPVTVPNRLPGAVREVRASIPYCTPLMESKDTIT